MEDTSTFVNIEGEQISLAEWLNEMISEVPNIQPKLKDTLKRLLESEEFKEIKVDDSYKEGSNEKKELKKLLSSSSGCQLTEILKIIVSMANSKEKEHVSKLVLSFQGQQFLSETEKNEKNENLKQQAVQETQYWSKQAEEKDIIIKELSKYFFLNVLNWFYIF